MDKVFLLYVTEGNVPKVRTGASPAGLKLGVSVCHALSSAALGRQNLSHGTFPFPANLHRKRMSLTRARDKGTEAK